MKQDRDCDREQNRSNMIGKSNVQLGFSVREWSDSGPDWPDPKKDPGIFIYFFLMEMSEN